MQNIISIKYFVVLIQSAHDDTVILQELISFYLITHSGESLCCALLFRLTIQSFEPSKKKHTHTQKQNRIKFLLKVHFFKIKLRFPQPLLDSQEEKNITNFFF